MESKIKLYGFGKYDRSGKIRWLAHETGLTVEECVVKAGEHREAAFREINPFATVPVVQWGDETLIESCAALIYIAEQFPEKKLIVQSDEADRFEFLKWMAIAGDTLEAKIVEYSLAQSGILPEVLIEINETALRFKLNIVLEQLPKQGYLVADRFTLADINLAYSLKNAVATGLIDMDSVRGYLSLLNEHPAARKAEFFGLITDKF